MIPGVNMIDASRGMLAISTSLDGYKQNSLQVFSRKRDSRNQCCYLSCDSCRCLALKSKGSNAANCDLNMLLKSECCCALFGGTRLSALRMVLSSNSAETSRIHTVHFEVTSVEHESACVEEGIPAQEEKKPFDDYSFEQAPVDYTSSVDQPSEFPKFIVNPAEDGFFYLEERDEEVLSKRILNLSRRNKVRSALGLYKSMEYSGLRANVHALNSLLSCLLRNGMLNDALVIFEFMKVSETISGHTCCILLKAIADTSGCDAALSMFEELESSSNQKKHFDAVVYNTMISIFGKLNNWVQTQKIWRLMQDNGQVGNAITYRLLICLFVRCGQNELALDAYHEMVQNGLEPSEDAMRAVIGACTKEGKWDLALNVLQNMLNRGLKPNVVAFNAIISSLGKAGKVKHAIKVYGLMKSLGHEPDAYTWNALLVALYRANRHSDALVLFERIRKRQSSMLSLHIYNTALMSCKRLGLWDRAVQLLWQMEASGLPVSTVSYNLVIGACEGARRPEVALEVYGHMVHQKHSPDTFTMLSLIRVCIWGSRWNEVEEILNGFAPNGSLYNAAVQGLCLQGKLDLARALYKKMNEYHLKPDGKTRALMLQNLPRKSNYTGLKGGLSMS